jgi:hypothetical protein
MVKEKHLANGRNQTPFVLATASHIADHSNSFLYWDYQRTKRHKNNNACYYLKPDSVAQFLNIIPLFFVKKRTFCSSTHQLHRKNFYFHTCKLYVLYITEITHNIESIQQYHSTAHKMYLWACLLQLIRFTYKRNITHNGRKNICKYLHNSQELLGVR